MEKYKNGVYEQYNNFCNSAPELFFASFDGRFTGLSNVIWKEYLEWQNNGGKSNDIRIRIMGDNKDILVWKIGNESYAQQIDKFAPFSIEQYKKGLEAVYSFLEDRPQYYKFRKMEGMFNPLKLLLYKFL